MDTKDKDFELASPGVMIPDSAMSPLLIENDTLNGNATQVVGPDDGLVILPGQKPRKSPTPLQESLRRMRRDKRARISLGVIILFIKHRTDGFGCLFRRHLQVHPLEVLLPSIVQTVLVLTFSFLGDGLRDAFDPRSKD